MKYGLYSPKCIVNMYSDRNIHYITRHEVKEFAKSILYVHIPRVKTNEREGYMYAMVCPDDVYILCYMNTVNPVIQMSVNRAKQYGHSLFGFGVDFDIEEYHCSNDGNVLIGNPNKVYINADKLRDYQVIAYDCRLSTPFIPNFKKEYNLSKVTDGELSFWICGIMASILLMEYIFL